MRYGPSARGVPGHRGSAVWRGVTDPVQTQHQMLAVMKEMPLRPHVSFRCDHSRSSGISALCIASLESSSATSAENIKGSFIS